MTARVIHQQYRKEKTMYLNLYFFSIYVESWKRWVGFSTDADEHERWIDVGYIRIYLKGR